MTDTDGPIVDDAPIATARDAAVAATAHGVTKGDEVSNRAVTINRPQSELYSYWRDFGNLPTFMDNIERIDVLDDKRSHWVVKAPAGRTVEWDAVLTQDDGQILAWETAAGADVPNSGRVEFRDCGARGTVVTATIAYDPPAGIVGKLVAKMFQREPATEARRDLRRFKQLMETGEIAVSARTKAQFEKERNS